MIDPLPPVDHSEIDYPRFTRDFYSEHSEISSLTSTEVNALRSKMGLKVTGYRAPRPCVSFAHFNFDDNLMNLIRKSEYSQPTGIQSQVSWQSCDCHVTHHVTRHAYMIYVYAVSGGPSCLGRERRHRNSQDWLREDSCFPAAHDGTLH